MAAYTDIHRFISISGVETKLDQIKSYSNSIDALPSLAISLHEARNRSTTDHKHSTNPAVPISSGSESCGLQLSKGKIRYDGYARMRRVSWDWKDHR